MSRKSFIRLGMVLFMVIAIGIATLVKPAHASPDQPRLNANAAEQACNSCHDNLYYNYDIGKAYCVGAARTRCVDCHDGDPTALDKASAHTNLVAYPVINEDDSRCQSCHQADSAARVARFAKIAGFRPIHYVTNETYNFIPQAGSTTAPAFQDEKDLSWMAKLLLSLATVLVFVGGFLISRILHRWRNGGTND